MTVGRRVWATLQNLKGRHEYLSDHGSNMKGCFGASSEFDRNGEAAMFRQYLLDDVLESRKERSSIVANF